MPNWCTGNIRFCGKLDDIEKLLSEEILFCKYEETSKNQICERETVEKPAKIRVVDDYEIVVSTPFDDSSTPNKSWCYINGTVRNFLNLAKESEFESRVLYRLQSDPNKYIAIFDAFEAAWSIEAEPYIEMSKKYNVDIRIIGWEQGIGFWQDIVIVNGEIIRNVCDDYGGYDGWMWESVLPYVGG